MLCDLIVSGPDAVFRQVRRKLHFIEEVYLKWDYLT